MLMPHIIDFFALNFVLITTTITNIVCGYQRPRPPRPPLLNHIEMSIELNDFRFVELNSNVCGGK